MNSSTHCGAATKRTMNEVVRVESMDDWFLTNDFLMTEMDLGFRHFSHARSMSSRPEQPGQAQINNW